ncbi:rhodanese-related sulfurtransferase [Allosphingosinicella flava]|uniref:tRNA uridine(34) hydroxylase n=1 Tax=Allosphingosinicella flava TaxID=2771430 RepID=A0A7T2GI68_9SPHN|nr:rhodanese-related sulfurtransferase [Sphingosinicella flava]QPQ53988.1 rhodanese-related sulfurtransferase [Sphingosinicella flava]
MTIRVTALYKFTPFEDPAAVKARLDDACAAAGINGTLLIAREGINGTIAGSHDGIEAALSAIRALPGCAGLSFKDSHAETMPFGRMKVRLKKEIVTMGEPDVDPLQGTGHYVAPEDWNALIADPGTVVIDTRNDYEVGIGTFKGAVDPKTESFREFPQWFRAHRKELEKAPRVAMFCTGGIRCEKATAFLKAEGIEEVYHLDGGILKYLETVPRQESLWQGECFVFDERVSVGHGLEIGTHVLCKPCGRPVSAEERRSPLYVEGVSCPHCTQ